MFAPSKASLGRKVSKSIKSSRENSEKTPRAGRVSFIINSFIAWVAAPVLLAKVLPIYTNKFSQESVDLFAGDGLTPERLLMLLIALMLSWFYTLARVKDVGWPILLSVIYCLPGPNILLFILRGNDKENGYGSVPVKPSMFKLIVALLLILASTAFVIAKPWW